jgi:hypothetical protein
MTWDSESHCRGSIPRKTCSFIEGIHEFLFSEQILIGWRRRWSGSVAGKYEMRAVAQSSQLYILVQGRGPAAKEFH